MKGKNENDQRDIIDDIIKRYNNFQIIPIVIYTEKKTY